MGRLSFLRYLPFAGFAIASLYWTARAPNGRKPPTLDGDLSLAAISNALTKVPHITSMLFIFALAVLAVGPRRAGLAALLTFAVGIGWEIGQMTVVGHNARAADMAPNLVGVAIGWAIVVVALKFVRRSPSGVGAR